MLIERKLIQFKYKKINTFSWKLKLETRGRKKHIIRLTEWSRIIKERKDQSKGGCKLNSNIVQDPRFGTLERKYQKGYNFRKKKDDIRRIPVV